MSRPPTVGVCPRSVSVGMLAAALCVLAADAAEPESQDALIQAQLESGEFAPALAMARRAATVEQRDAWLAQIAQAQARAGARNASLRSAAEIYDDQTRTRALANVAAQPWGGRGGGSQADFDSLIELITSTIQPTTWDEVGGPGPSRRFPRAFTSTPKACSGRF